jgi:hypothetical protein
LAVSETASRPHVLVAEDDPDTLPDTWDIFELDGYAVEAVGTGAATCAAAPCTGWWRSTAWGTRPRPRPPTGRPRPREGLIHEIIIGGEGDDPFHFVERCASPRRL